MRYSAPETLGSFALTDKWSSGRGSLKIDYLTDNSTFSGKKAYWLTISENTDAWSSLKNTSEKFMQLDANTDYILSFKTFLGQNCSGVRFVLFVEGDSKQLEIHRKTKTGTSGFAYSNQIKFRNTLGEKVYLCIYNMGKVNVSGSDSNLVFSNIQIEKGTKATDWSPAPEDVQGLIDSKANSADVYNKSETYTKSETESKINIAKNDITLSVSNTYETKSNVETKVNNAVNNIQIGGRNLFLNSGFTKGLNYWYTHNCSNPQAVADSSALSGYAVKFTSTGGGIYQRKGGASNTPTNYPNGSIMTVSGYVKSSVAGKVLRPNFENAGPNTSKNITCTNANTWYYFTHTYTITSHGFSTVTFYGDSGADYYLKDVILEYGNIASTWTPAPEDVDSAINSKAYSTDVY